VNNFRAILITINLVVLAGIIGFILYRVISLRRNPDEKPAQNLVPFHSDEVLEGPHLERVLGVALVALVVIVIGLVAYFIWEPFRGAEADTAYLQRSIARGATLFANNESPNYDATKSLLCANCHGVDATGGSATFVIASSDPACTLPAKLTQDYAESHPQCLPQTVEWAAPNLTTEPLRFTRQQITQIITYGRPGTPMPAWGVASGKGALDTQSIEDLVNYIESIKVTPQKALAESDANAAALQKQLADPEVKAAADKWVVDQQAILAKAQAAQAALPATAGDSDKQTAAEEVEYQQDVLNVAQQWQQTTRQASEGQILFMTNCARCHTHGWSYFDPTNPEGNPPPGLMGGGAYGPNLTNGDENRQFPPPDGNAQLFTWIYNGVPANQQYGSRGISSGRMPNFGGMLTTDQICNIMDFERNIDNPPAQTDATTSCPPGTVPKS
jgi:mono/diheme cytochrome c family protein